MIKFNNSGLHFVFTIIIFSTCEKNADKMRTRSTKQKPQTAIN